MATDVWMIVFSGILATAKISSQVNSSRALLESVEKGVDIMLIR